MLEAINPHQAHTQTQAAPVPTAGCRIASRQARQAVRQLAVLRGGVDEQRGADRVLCVDVVD